MQVALFAWERSGQNNVVDRDKDELDNVSNEAHNNKAHRARLENLQVLRASWLFALVKEDFRVSREISRLSKPALGLCALLLHILLCHL